MPSSYVSGRFMSDQTEHSGAIIVGYVPSGHYFLVLSLQCLFLSPPLSVFIAAMDHREATSSR
jgi:hypothetical protein